MFRFDPLNYIQVIKNFIWSTFHWVWQFHRELIKVLWKAYFTHLSGSNKMNLTRIRGTKIRWGDTLVYIDTFKSISSISNMAFAIIFAIKINAICMMITHVTVLWNHVKIAVGKLGLFTWTFVDIITNVIFFIHSISFFTKTVKTAVVIFNRFSKIWWLISDESLLYLDKNIPWQ